MLSKEEERRTLIDGCRHLEGVGLQLFGGQVWKSHGRIEV